MPPHRAYELRKREILANFRTPVWKLQKRERPRDQRPGMDPEHLANIRKLPCCLCGERGKFVHAHHLQSGAARKERGVGLKATDRHAISLCVAHHTELHRLGSRREIEFFAERGVDCHALASGLWNRRGDSDAMARVLLAHQLQAAATIARKK